jgi:hypothetical protein
LATAEAAAAAAHQSLILLLHAKAKLLLLLLRLVWPKQHNSRPRLVVNDAARNRLDVFQLSPRVYKVVR